MSGRSCTRGRQSTRDCDNGETETAVFSGQIESFPERARARACGFSRGFPAGKKEGKKLLTGGDRSPVTREVAER